MMDIINNNRPNSNKDIYIKNIVFSHEEFDSINSRIADKFDLLQHTDIDLNTFRSWSLLATLLGFFTVYDKAESTKLFMRCVACCYLPQVIIKHNRDNVHVCICILEKELDERSNDFKHTA